MCACVRHHWHTAILLPVTSRLPSWALKRCAGDESPSSTFLLCHHDKTTPREKPANQKTRIFHCIQWKASTQLATQRSTYGRPTGFRHALISMENTQSSVSCICHKGRHGAAASTAILRHIHSWLGASSESVQFLSFFFYTLLQQCACYRLHNGSRAGALWLVSVTSSGRCPILALAKLVRFLRPRNFKFFSCYSWINRAYETIQMIFFSLYDHPKIFWQFFLKIDSSEEFISAIENIDPGGSHLAKKLDPQKISTMNYKWNWSLGKQRVPRPPERRGAPHVFPLFPLRCYSIQS